MSILARQNFEQLTTTKLVAVNTPLALFCEKKKKLVFIFSFDLQRKEFKKWVKHLLFFFLFSIHKKNKKKNKKVEH